MNAHPPSPPHFEEHRTRPTHPRYGGQSAPQGAHPNLKRRRRPAPKTSLAGKIFFGFALLLVSLGTAGAVAAYMLSPAEIVKAEAIRRVKAATGRDLVIAGQASFRVFPSIGFTLEDVSLSAPEGSNAKPLVAMSSLDLSVRLLTLLRRQVVVDRLILKNPVVELHVDKSGRKTWDFAGRPSASLVRVAQAGGATSDAPGGLASDTRFLVAQDTHSAPQAGDNASHADLNLENLELGNVRVENGTLNYSDATTGARQEASSINVRVSLRSISRPLETEGDFVWKDEKIGIDAKLTSIKSLMDMHPARLVATIASRPVNASYDGSFIVRDGLDAEGTVTADAASLRGLAAWLGTGLPDVSGFGPVQVKALTRINGKVATINNANIVLDGATITGQATVDTAPARPYIKGNLKFSELDLNKYAGPSGAPGSRPAQAPSKTKNAAPAASIDDLLGDEPAAKPGPRVQGYTQRAGWSEGPIDASALGLADADVQLTVGKLLFKEIKVGQSVLTVALKSGVMRTAFDDIQLYGGHGRGIVTLDATAPKIAAIGANIQLEGISALPLLKDAADMDWLAGTGKVSLQVAGQGTNQRQIVEALNGKADILFTNGAIVGWNIPGMVRGISQGKISALNRTPAEKTDFSELSSTWTIASGVAQNQDLRLVSPLLRVGGSGAVMLGARQIDYTVRPTLVSSLEGQGASGQAAGLEIPVRVHGSWEKPAFTPDVGGILKDPNQAAKAVKEFGKQFKGKNANEIVKGLLGEGGDPKATPQTGSTEPPKAKQLLDQLFKQ